LRGEGVQRRRRYGAWREPVIFWIDAHQKARRKAREKVQLQSIEAKALVARGVAEPEAMQKAAQVADLMVAQAAQVEKDLGAFAAAGQTAALPAAPAPTAALASAPPPVTSPANFQKLLETARHPETSTASAAPARRVSVSLTRLAAGLVGP